MDTVNVLVDYDNLLPRRQQYGVIGLAEQIVSQLNGCVPSVPDRLLIRLYGGWCTQTNLTKRAQRLAADIRAACFPRIVCTATGSVTQKVAVNVELALGLHAEPSQVLLHTFREQRQVRGLRCRNPQDHGCGAADCILSVLHSFLSNGLCPQPGCTLTPGELFYRDEQKLVDTMLTADLVYLARGSTTCFVVVSSDDDLWPAIRLALLAGHSVVHLHTKPQRRTAAHYCRGVGAAYSQRNLEE